jgi:hypothetical protein
LLTEQYFIDHLQPNLIFELVVNWGGQPNKGSLGYSFSEEEKKLRSFRLRGREFSEFTKNLHRDNMTGKKLSNETRNKMRDSHGGVTIICTNRENGEQIIYPTKSAAALALECSIRSISRKCGIKDTYKFKGKTYILSYKISD